MLVNAGVNWNNCMINEYYIGSEKISTKFVDTELESFNNEYIPYVFIVPISHTFA